MAIRLNFLTTTNKSNGYGMTREYLKKFLPKHDIILEPVNAGNDVTFIFHIPPAISHSKTNSTILYTMLEGDTVPDSWYPYLEKATYILVPSNFVKETFSRAGFDTQVVPLGYDPSIFRFVEREEKDTFTFLHYEAFQDRKGWEELLDAWIISGLAEEEGCRLVLKTILPYNEVYNKLHRPSRFENTIGYTDDLLSAEFALPSNIKVISGELPHRCLFDLLSEADVFVFPSRGEGFSLPPIEAMATGLPVILSKAHSHLDYFDERYMYGVDASIKIPAAYSNWGDQGYFTRCNVDSLAMVLRYVYEHRKEARQVGHLASNYVKKYNYERTSKVLSYCLWQIHQKLVQ